MVRALGDGFRFDLASIMTRASSQWDARNVFGQPTASTPHLEEVEIGSPLEAPPLVDMISNDPILKHVKLIAEAWWGAAPAAGSTRRVSPRSRLQ